MPPRIAAAGRTLALAAAYAVPALLLGWTVGGQAMLGRIDAMLVVPLLMPGALLFAWLTRADPWPLGVARAGTALLLLFVSQMALHHVLAGRLGGGQAGTALLAGGIGLALAGGAVRRTVSWRLWARALLFASAIAVWFAAGQLAVGWWYRDAGGGTRAPVVMLTGLPLRWAGGAGDIRDLLAAGPADAPALAALEAAVPLRLVDTLDGLSPRDVLFLAHPRALSPGDLVRIDRHVQSGGDAVILADALSSWHPPHPLGDPRNPPITSLLTPLLDHWGVELAVPDAEGAGQAGIFIDPDGWMLRLQSAGRFVRLPAGCQAYGGARAARCRIGHGRAWLIGDADMLDADLWQSPVATAPWLRRSDNVAWLIDVLRDDPAGGGRAPLWIRSRAH